MQKVEEIKVNYKQCQDVLDCAEKRLQTNGLGVTTEGQCRHSSLQPVRQIRSFRSGCHSEECLHRNDQCGFEGQSNA